MNLRAAFCSAARLTLELFDTSLRPETLDDEGLRRLHAAEAEVARLGVLLAGARAQATSLTVDLELAALGRAEAEEACQEQLARAERLTAELATAREAAAEAEACENAAAMALEAVRRPACGDPIARKTAARRGVFDAGAGMNDYTGETVAAEARTAGEQQ